MEEPKISARIQIMKPLVHITEKKDKIILVLEGDTDLQIAELIQTAMREDHTLFAIMQYAFTLAVLDRLKLNNETVKRSHIV